MESEHFQVARRATGDPVRVWKRTVSIPTWGVSEASAIISSMGISACKAFVVMFGLLQEKKKLLQFA